jgi:hypothetical protein
VIARLLLWSLGETPLDPDELLGGLPPLAPPSAWLWNEAGERFGVLLVDDEIGEVPDALAAARDRIGREPDLYEEFDIIG